MGCFFFHLNKISILTLIFSLTQKKISKFEEKNNENTKIDESETKEVESLIPRTFVTGSHCGFLNLSNNETFTSFKHIQSSDIQPHIRLYYSLSKIQNEKQTKKLS